MTWTSGLPRWIDDEFYNIYSTDLRKHEASPDAAELGNLMNRAEDMLRWGYPLRALQAYLRCLSKQVYFIEAHYECLPSLVENSGLDVKDGLLDSPNAPLEQAYL